MALNTFSSLQAMDVNISKMKELCKCAQVSFKNYVVPINLNLYNLFKEINSNEFHQDRLIILELNDQLL